MRKFNYHTQEYAAPIPLYQSGQTKSNIIPVDEKSGVVYSSPQSMISGRLTITPSPRRMLHNSSISAIALCIWADVNGFFSFS